MTNKYLEKIAASKDKTSKKEGSSWHPIAALGAATAGGLLSAPIAAVGQEAGRKLNNQHMFSNHRIQNVVNMPTIKKFMKENNLSKETTLSENKVVQKNKGVSSVGRMVAHDLNTSQRPAYYSPLNGKGVVGGVRTSQGVNKDVLMHELGHVKDFSKAKTIKRGLSLIGRTPAAQVAAVGALSHDSTRDYAVPLAAAGAGIVLREEAAANYHAYKAVKKHQGSEAANLFAKKIIKPNTINYGATLGAGVAAAYAGKKILDKVYSNKNKEMAKKASTLQKTKGLGSYLLHNAVVPGAVIFGADLGAYAAAEKLVKKPETPKV